MSNKRALDYFDGLGTGIAIVAMLGIFWLSSATASYAQMYRDIGPGVVLPGMTQLVLSTAWRLGVPLVLVGALVAAHVWRPRFAMVAIALATIGVVLFWYLAAYAPLFQVAGNIR